MIIYNEKEDSRSEDPFFSQEDYDAKRDAVLAISGLVNDKATTELLKKSGIEKGTDDYVTAIADMYNIVKQIQETRAQRSKGVGELSQVYRTKEFQDKVAKLADYIMSVNTQFSQQLEDAKKNAGDVAVTNAKKTREDLKAKPKEELKTEEEKKLAGLDLTTEELY